MVFLNGQLLPDDQARISIFDRGFLYGDGLFETVRVQNGRLFRWDQHLARFTAGAAVLGIEAPYSSEELLRAANAIIDNAQAHDALVRLTLSRGVGGPAYSPAGANQPTIALSLRETSGVNPSSPAQWRAVTSTFRVAADDSLARVKTCNKLHQVLARAEAEARGADEALLLNTRDQIAEGTGSNVFWVDRETVCTPPLQSGVLPGITRRIVLELCAELTIPVEERPGVLAAVREADAVFLTLSSLGIVELLQLDDNPLRSSRVTGRLHQAYQSLVQRETGGAGS